MSGAGMEPHHGMDANGMKAARKALGFTQAGLAEALGMTRKTIGEMERGAAPIERRTVLSIRYLEIVARDKGLSIEPGGEMEIPAFTVDERLLELLDARYERRSS